MIDWFGRRVGCKRFEAVPGRFGLGRRVGWRWVEAVPGRFGLGRRVRWWRWVETTPEDALFEFDEIRWTLEGNGTSGGVSDSVGGGGRWVVWGVSDAAGGGRMWVVGKRWFVSIGGGSEKCK